MIIKITLTKLIACAVISTACAAPPPRQATVAPAAAAPAAQAQPVAAGVTEVHVKLTEFKVELDRTSAPLGAVKFIIDNAGQKDHELLVETVEGADKPFAANGKEAEVADLKVGQSATLEWTFDKTGTFLLSCHVGKHFERGMKIEFTITDK